MEKYTASNWQYEFTFDNINYAKEFVEELHEAALAFDFSKNLHDLLFSIEVDYQNFYELDEDNWEIVHDRMHPSRLEKIN